MNFNPIVALLMYVILFGTKNLVSHNLASDNVNSNDSLGNERAENYRSTNNNGNIPTLLSYIIVCGHNAINFLMQF